MFRVSLREAWHCSRIRRSHGSYRTPPELPMPGTGPNNREEPSGSLASDRLDSWKEIAAYLKRDERTVRRWEEREGLPIHRHQHKSRAAIFAYKSELDAWWNNGQSALETQEQAQGGSEASAKLPAESTPSVYHTLVARRWVALAAGLLLIAPVIAYRIAMPKRPSAQMRIVVLPFQNMTGDPNQEFFADGMTEEMISQLGATNPARLGVIGRTSAVKYKNSGKGIDQIGHELGVDYVLKGSVRDAGTRVRVTAQLIRVSDQMHVWSESLDRGFKDVVELQSDVAQAIARRIDVGLGQRRAAPQPATQLSWEAYSAYLKGRHLLLDNKTEATIAVALQYFQRAIELDPSFALAYAGLADAYAERADADLDPKKAYELSREAAMRALSINPDLAEAHVSMANELFYGEWKWAVADREYKRALELKPTYEEAHHSYSHYLTLAGRHQEAIEESQLLLRLDPLSSHMNSHLGLAYLKAGRFDEALAQFKKTVALDRNYMRVYVHLGFAYEWRKMFPEAITAYKKGVSLAGETLEGQADLARALIEGSERKEGLLILRRLEL